MKTTTSICPNCLTEIPAFITMADQAVMVKHCSVCHTTTESIVEPSLSWYQFCQSNGSKKFYDGVMVDVSTRCNLKCKYCYHENAPKELETEYILAEIDKIEPDMPIILTGGEPTLNEALPLLIERSGLKSPVIVLTNGVRLAEREYFNKLEPYLSLGDVLRVGLSFHKESNGSDFRFLDLCRAKGRKVATAFYVIDDIYQINDAIKIYDQYADVICSLRIKAASNLGQSQNVKKHIFTSDMVQYVMFLGGEMNFSDCQKISYASMKLNGRDLYLISWYNANNVDLEDIDCPPYYMAKDGKYYNLVTTCIKDGVKSADI